MTQQAVSQEAALALVLGISLPIIAATFYILFASFRESRPKEKQKGRYDDFFGI